jgi:hypothetical protein
LSADSQAEAQATAARAQSRHQFCQNLGTAFENPDLPHRATPTALGEIVAL